MSFLLLQRTLVRRFSTRLYATASSPAPRSPSSFIRGLVFATGLGSAFTAGSLYPPDFATYVSPRIAPPPPADDTPEAIALVTSLEQQLETLPLLQRHRSQPDADDWYEARPYTNFPELKRVHHLTAGALRGPGKLAIRPLIRAKNDESEAWVFVHLGRSLCGHDGIVHGGLMATILDEALGRTAFFNLPARIAVTANLNVNYRAPTKADQFIVIKVFLTEQKGRKAVVSARVEDMDGNVLQDATAIFVQPKYANLLNAGPIAAMVGQKPSIDKTPAVPSPVAEEAGLVKG